MPTIVFLIMPFFASMLFGICYVLIERTIGIHINPVTFLLINAIALLACVAGLVVFKGEVISFKGMFSSTPILLMTLIAISTAVVGWVLSVYAIKNVSAVYTAFSETSYPLFTLAFGFLLFGMRSYSLSTICGGLLILVGAVIMITGHPSQEE